MKFDASEIATLWHSDPARCVAEFQEGIDAGDIDCMVQGIVHLEWDARINNGEMPYHSVDMQDMYFKHTKAKLLELRKILKTKHEDFKSSSGITMLRAFTADALGEDSQSFYDLTAESRPGSIADMVHYDWMEPCPLAGQLNAALVPIRDIPPGNPNHVVMVSMDQNYAQKYLSGFVNSYQQYSDQGLMVHLMDCEYPFVEEVKSREGFGIVAEWPEAGRVYYHAVRFIRMAHLMANYGKKWWLADADILFSGDMTEIFDLPGDLVWRARPGRLEPWNQINACLFGCSDWNYLAAVAGYIHRLGVENSLHWGADQMAMWAVYKSHQATTLSVSLLDYRQLCYDETTVNPIVTAYSGARKKLLEARAA
jgi:hypothetical protein